MSVSWSHSFGTVTHTSNLSITPKALYCTRKFNKYVYGFSNHINQDKARKLWLPCSCFNQ